MRIAQLKSYAELIARVGGNVQRGQYVVIRANVALERFAELVGRECYKLGAKRVLYRWESARTDRADYRLGKVKSLSETLPQEYGWQQFLTDELPVTIWLDGDDPDGLRGLDAHKIAEIKARRHEAVRHFIDARENRYQWTIAGAPTIPWAKKVFPHKTKCQAVDALWEAILHCARADHGDPVENWEEHEATLKAKCEVLNSLHLRKLHYIGGNGTDLTVGLIPGVRWLAGGEETMSGSFFQPNIPSEECFTSPMKGEAEGVVYASKPLNYNGQLVDKFWLRFAEGKAVEAHAEVGEEVLQSILGLDEGSAYLGECALVPWDSPINQTGILFYNTLFDENACCHLALGRGFTNLYPDFERYSSEEIHRFGINKSLSHVDFMIGTPDLKIVGTDQDGEEVVLFENGVFAI